MKPQFWEASIWLHDLSQLFAILTEERELRATQCGPSTKSQQVVFSGFVLVSLLKSGDRSERRGGLLVRLVIPIHMNRARP